MVFGRRSESSTPKVRSGLCSFHAIPREAGVFAGRQATGRDIRDRFGIPVSRPAQEPISDAVGRNASAPVEKEGKVLGPARKHVRHHRPGSGHN